MAARRRVGEYARGGFMAVPPSRRSATEPPSHLRQARVVTKRGVEQPVPHMSAPFSNQATGSDGEDGRISATVPQQLAFDELLRVQRSRAEDVAKLVAEVANGERVEEKERRAVTYREEWRIGREDEIMKRVQAEEALNEALPANERVYKEEALRNHCRRSIHVFLPRHANPLASASASVSAPHKATRMATDLLYAQQMDFILATLDREPAFEVVRRVMLQARARFQRILQGTIDTPSEVKTTELIAARQAEDTREENKREILVPETEPDVLQLYENVVHTNVLAGTTRAKATAAPSAAFLTNLARQREQAEHEAAQVLAQTHWRNVCASRISRQYRMYRRRQRWWMRWQALLLRTRHRAAVVLQTRLLPVSIAFYRLKAARQAVLRRHQAHRIASCCFWRCIYWRRCGFASFQFSHAVSCEVIASVVRIQCCVRGLRARRELVYRLELQRIRVKRSTQARWQAWHAISLRVAAVNHRVAEWTCHVSVERRRVARELVREDKRLAWEWERYEAKLAQDVLSAKLPPEWIPQLDIVSGSTYYLNIQTSKTSREHPGHAVLRQLVKKQRVRAEELCQQRKLQLEVYGERLEAEHEAAVDEMLQLTEQRLQL